MTPIKTQNNTQLHAIEAAIEDIKNGKVIIVVDDENRENEGDFLAAAEMATPEMVNFMATHGRGLICTPLTENRCKELGLGNDGTKQYRPHGNRFYRFGRSTRKRSYHRYFCSR